MRGLVRSAWSERVSPRRLVAPPFAAARGREILGGCLTGPARWCSGTMATGTDGRAAHRLLQRAATPRRGRQPHGPDRPVRSGAGNLPRAARSAPGVCLEPAEARREAQEVSLEEGANAAVRVLRLNIALSQDEQVKLTAKSLSFPRAGGRGAKYLSPWSRSSSSTAARSARVTRWSLRSVTTLE